jgi:hypothetical protein
MRRLHYLMGENLEGGPYFWNFCDTLALTL